MGATSRFARPCWYLPIWAALLGLAVFLQYAHFSYRGGWVPGGLLLHGAHWVDGAILLRLILAAIVRQKGFFWLLYVALGFATIPLIQYLRYL